jgi:antitoxin (DNA-binding transcriptional repressor) of toxin-antitoxin stability system
VIFKKYQEITCPDALPLRIVLADTERVHRRRTQGGIRVVNRAMSKQVNIYDAKSRSQLVNDVESGADIVVARQGPPMARLVPIVGNAPAPDADFDTRAIWCDIEISASGVLTVTCGPGCTPIDAFEMCRKYVVDNCSMADTVWDPD